MSKQKTYEELLSEAQGFLKRDVETRFRIAKVLYQMVGFKSRNQIAYDLGWSAIEVGQYVRVIEVWGDRRIPADIRNEWGGHQRPAAWRDYTVATPVHMNEYVREHYINTCLQYGTEGPAKLQRIEMSKAAAERSRLRAEEVEREEQARRDARSSMTAMQRKRESQLYSSIYVEILDEHVRSELCRYVPKIEELDKRSREKLEKLYDDLIRDFAKLGIVDLPDDLQEEGAA